MQVVMNRSMNVGGGQHFTDERVDLPEEVAAYLLEQGHVRRPEKSRAAQVIETATRTVSETRTRTAKKTAAKKTAARPRR